MLFLSLCTHAISIIAPFSELLWPSWQRKIHQLKVSFRISRSSNESIVSVPSGRYRGISCINPSKTYHKLSSTQNNLSPLFLCIERWVYTRGKYLNAINARCPIKMIPLSSDTCYCDHTIWTKNKLVSSSHKFTGIVPIPPPLPFLLKTNIIQPYVSSPPKSWDLRNRISPGLTYGNLLYILTQVKCFSS